jgi:hypothetical protein
MTKLIINTDTGYRAELHVDDPDEKGIVCVKSAAYIFKNVLSPFIALRYFNGDNATRKAEKYARDLKRALEEGL